MMHIPLGHPVYFILRNLIGAFNPKATSLNENVQGHGQMIYLPDVLDMYLQDLERVGSGGFDTDQQ